jgi:hypothetical protein
MGSQTKEGESFNNGGILALENDTIKSSTAVGANPGDAGEGGGIANTGPNASLTINGNSVVVFDRHV